MWQANTVNSKALACSFIIQRERKKERQKLEMGKARTVGVGMDYSPISKAALRWAADNLMEEGDRIILIHVQPPKSDHTRKALFEDTGSRLFLLT